jgi:nucleoid-associated protein YgaU
VKKAATKVVKAPAKAVKKAAKAPVEAPAKVPAEAPAPAPAVALRRGRQPVNPEAEFKIFRATHRIGSRVEGDVKAFTSHGAVIKVTLKGDQHVECYAPTTLLGNPAPARARDVLKRGDHRTFRLVTVDIERRIAELALP